MTIRERLADRSAEVLRLKEALDCAFASGARASSAPEDRIVFPLGVAFRDIIEEVLFSVSEGFGRLALRSVRTMYECVIFARYLSLHPDKTDDYLATFHAQWALVLKNAPDAAAAMPEVHNVISERVPAYAAGKHVGLDWSDQRTLEMAEEVGIPGQFHAWAFKYASGFVHPSAMFLLRHMSQGIGEIMEISTKPQDREAWLALRLSHCLILNMLNLRLKYALLLTLAEREAVCRKDFAEISRCPCPI